MTAAIFYFMLSLPAFGGMNVTVEVPTMAGCLDARAAARKQLMMAGLPTDSITKCQFREPAPK